MNRDGKAHRPDRERVSNAKQFLQTLQTMEMSLVSFVQKSLHSQVTGEVNFVRDPERSPDMTLPISVS